MTVDPLFDVGVLMGTRSNDIFDEFSQYHPGAKFMVSNWRENCQCGERDCWRTFFQDRVVAALENDKAIVTQFLDAVYEDSLLGDFDFIETSERFHAKTGYPRSFQKEDDGTPPAIVELARMLEQAGFDVNVRRIDPDDITRH